MKSVSRSQCEKSIPAMLFLDKVEQLTKTNRLSSGFINRAMQMLSQQHPDIGGLYCCTLGASLEYPQATGDKWMQIIHDGSNHWVLASKGFSKTDRDHVMVYDSSAGDLSEWKCDHVVSCMSSLLKTSKKEMIYIIKSCQQQGNGYDCGVFAIAFATSLANGIDPATLLYNPDTMRTHLDSCMKSGVLLPFPSTTSRIKRSRKDVVKKVPLFCYCRTIDYSLTKDDDMTWIECGNCMEWFHKMCVKEFPVNIKNDWSCKMCQK